MPEEPTDPVARLRFAENMRAEAMASLSVTRDGNVEITSARQVNVLEDAGRRILAMRLDDPSINAAAASMLDRAAAARHWTWVNQPTAVALAVVAVLAGVGTAVLGGTSGNIAVAAVGAIVGGALLGVAVLRYRREIWRIRAEQIAPMISRPGI